MENQVQMSNVREAQNNKDSQRIPMHLVSVGDSLVSYARKIAEEELKRSINSASKNSSF